VLPEFSRAKPTATQNDAEAQDTSLSVVPKLVAAAGTASMFQDEPFQTSDSGVETWLDVVGRTKPTPTQDVAEPHDTSSSSLV
jgi:hypothetical protein